MSCLAAPEEPIPTGTGSEPAPTGAGAEQSLIADLEARGALVAVEPRARGDGVRGLFAVRDLDAEEMACWVPNEVVLDVSTCDPELLRAVDAVLDERGFSDVERGVYRRMVALTAGYLLERSRGTASRFHRYIEALPPYPPTMNTFSPAERAALAAMTGQDIHSMYQSLVDVAVQCLQRADSLVGGTGVPTREETEAAFFFVQTRMSNLRLIPLVDLANAALEGTENARILVDGQVVGNREGCALVAKRPVKAGEEIIIDYNHHDAVGMLTGYGCTLDLEGAVSVTTMQFCLPNFLKGTADAKEFLRGARLREDEPAGLPEKAVLLLRMAAMGTVEEFVTAARAGYFNEPPTGPEEKVKAWDRRSGQVYAQIADFCEDRLRKWEANVAPAVAGLDEGTLAGRVAIAQHRTETRLLLRCKDAMRARAAEVGAS